MALTKDDLREIGKLINGAVEASESRMSGAIQASETRMSAVMDNAVQASETRVLAVINELASDMDERFARVDMKLNQFRSETNERFDQLETKVDRLQNQMDSVASDYKTLYDEETANVSFNVRAGDRLDDHETRISALEQAGSAAA
jgi:outer membrane murein-binding lipoprotein Lpp